MTQTTISVPDISCDHCKTSIEAAVGSLAGVGHVEVHVAPRSVDVEYDESSVTIETIRATIEDQGYEVAGT